ncbi:MAG: hypothetical protein V3V08_07370 [Nannocystaceae bacterium]
MKKLGEQPAYPTGKQEGYSPSFGLTHRQRLAGQIASGIRFNEVTDGNYQVVAQNVWRMTDAILEAEHET